MNYIEFIENHIIIIDKLTGKSEKIKLTSVQKKFIEYLSNTRNE